MSNTPLIPCWLIQLQSLIEQLTFQFYGAVTPHFNSLIPTPSLPSLVCTEPVELLCRISNINTTDPFCFVKKTGNGQSFRATFICKYAQLPSVRRTKTHGDKGYHTALITIKQGNQHADPNRNPKRNQADTTIRYSFRHVYVLTKIAKIHVVILYI